jgi:HNH endonuclease
MGKRANRRAVFLLNTALNYAGDDCLIWPFSLSRTGYALLKFEGRQRSAHRLLCELAHGPAPAREHHAAHRCGAKACVSPAHLRWATPTDNIADKITHGTATRGNRCHSSKLDERAVLDIRQMLANGQTQGEIASHFNVSRASVKDIKHKRSWAWL